MPANVLASFITFIITGIYTFWFVSDIKLDFIIKVFLFVTIIANAMYFFYFEALTEISDNLKVRLKAIGRHEWFIRIFNQTLLFSLWFLLELHPIAFCSGLLLLYTFFIIWDGITKSCFDDRKLFALDIIGFVLSILFISFFLYYLYVIQIPQTPSQAGQVVSQQSPSSNFSFLWGVIALAYLGIPILGFFFTKFELFKKVYYTRENIM